MSWIDPIHQPEGDDLVQVLCEVLPEEDGAALPVSSGDHGEGDRFVSVGFPVYGDDHGGEDGWQIAGWLMTQDCWTSASRYRVLGWQPLATTEHP